MQYSKIWDNKCLALVARTVEHSVWIRRLGVQEPNLLRHFLSQKLRHFLKYIRSWVVNECCCLCTIDISNVNFKNTHIYIYIYVYEQNHPSPYQTYRLTLVHNVLTKEWTTLHEASDWSTALNTTKPPSCKAWFTPVGLLQMYFCLVKYRMISSIRFEVTPRALSYHTNSIS